MGQKKTAELGSVSHATMRAQDVLPACLGVLEEFDKAQADKFWKEVPKDAQDDDDHDWWDSEDCSYLLNEDVWDAMQEIAPPYCYFGSHPGDGSDFGFWVCEDFVERPEDYGVRKTDDHPETPSDNDDETEYLHVSDHGNAELYAWNGEKFESVWGIV